MVNIDAFKNIDTVNKVRDLVSPFKKLDKVILVSSYPAKLVMNKRNKLMIILMATFVLVFKIFLISFFHIFSMKLEMMKDFFNLLTPTIQ